MHTVKDLNFEDLKKKLIISVADPGGVQCVQTPALLFRCPFSKRTYFENMLLRFLAEQGAVLTIAILVVELLSSCLSFIFENIKCRENVRPSTLDLRCPLQMDWTPALIKS